MSAFDAMCLEDNALACRKLRQGICWRRVGGDG